MRCEGCERKRDVKDTRLLGRAMPAGCKGAHFDLEFRHRIFMAEGEYISWAELFPDAWRKELVIHPGFPNCDRVMVAIVL
jgi:hypothetical protein